MLTKAIYFLLLSITAVFSWAQQDAYGGWQNLQGRKTGFFHTEQVNGRWWLITPEGNAFFAKGVCKIDSDRKEIVPQLKGWGFNTVGSWSEQLPGMPYTLVLNLAASTQPDLWKKGIIVDYFSPEFREGVERRAAELCPALADDPWLLGYFTDNEMRWLPDIRSNESILEVFLKKPVESPGYQRAMAFLKERGHTPDSVTEGDKDDFLELAAGEYARIAHAAIRRHDRNHLILGGRFNNRAPIPLSRAVGPYYDVISYNNYDHRAPIYRLREISEVTGKPVMLTEFSFKAVDSGLPNTKGAGDTIATQQDRADLYAGYVEDLARLPSCVGFLWFQYRDQPKEGRDPGGGGENSNYGLVKRDGTPWTVLTTRMTAVNAGLETLAAKSGKHDTYGGWRNLKGRETGFFHTEQIDGRWWLITPEGNAFFSKGVCAVDTDREEAAHQLDEWGFNTLGASSARLPGMAYTLLLDLAASTAPDRQLKGAIPDYFSPEFRAAVDRRAAELCRPLAEDPWLIGYFTDNELYWVTPVIVEGDVRLGVNLLAAFLKKPLESPGYQKATAFLAARGRKEESATDDDRDDFLELAAAEYGQVCREAIRRYDPNHLILGCRYSSRAPLPLSRGLGRYFDVISFNNYDWRAPLYKLDEISKYSGGKPTLVSEFSFKAVDSRLPNSVVRKSLPLGMGQAVRGQQDRADLYAAYVRDLAGSTSCIGFHWFQYRDQPKEGRPSDGENNNWGLVKQDGSPWTALTTRMTEINAELEALAADRGRR